MIKVLGLLGVATFTFTNVNGPPVNTRYNNGLVDYYITYQMMGDDDVQNATFCYTSPVKINQSLGTNYISALNGDVELRYGDDYYTEISDTTPVGRIQETEVYIDANRQNFYLDINNELSSTIEILIDGEPIPFDYSISVNYKLTNKGYNDAQQLLYPKYIDKSQSFGGTHSAGTLNYFQLFVDHIYQHTSTQNYLDIIYIESFNVDITAYNDYSNGDLTINIDNNYSTTNNQFFIMQEYNDYIDTFLEDVIVPDFQLSTYLINSVGGFMDFEIAPNISLGSILGIVLAFGLVFFIIKYFAGG